MNCLGCNAVLPPSDTTCLFCGQRHWVMKNQYGEVIDLTKARDEPDLPHDIVAETVMAYRIWHVDTDYTVTLTSEDLRDMAAAWDEGRNPFKNAGAPWLEGVGVDSLWARPVHEAECKPLNKAKLAHYEPPEPTCECGIWALKEEAYIGRTLAKYHSEKCAWGTVLLWGRIVETELGYRAQYAQPLSIHVSGLTAQEAIELAEVYECEVWIADELPISEEDEAIAVANAMGAQNMAQAMQNLQQAFATAMTPAVTKANQAITTALGAMPEPELPKYKSSRLKRIVDAFFSRWFFLSLAVINLSLFSLDGSWFSLASGAVCLAFAIPQFHPLKKLTKLAIFVIPYVICLFVWAFITAGALILDWLLSSEPNELGEGKYDAWAWDHDPVKWIEKRW